MRLTTRHEFGLALCKRCKVEFHKRAHNQIYCTVACNDAPKPVRQAICANQKCKEYFATSRDDAKYCCAACRCEARLKPARSLKQGDVSRSSLSTQEDLLLMGSPQPCADGPHADQRRHLDCVHHKSCLDYAVAAKWDGFACGDCYVPKPRERPEPWSNRTDRFREGT